MSERAIVHRKEYFIFIVFLVLNKYLSFKKSVIIALFLP